uniref:Uncharacterized protein n=1 Tax=Brassica campestris TaxID=3711 RepID=M4FBX1_BRACM
MVGAEEDGGGGDVEEDDGVSEAGPADGIGAFFREVNYDSSFAAGSGGGSWGGPQLQPLFLAQSSSSRSIGHEIKLLRRVFAISSWSSCSAPTSRRGPTHGRAHLATAVPPPTRPSSRNPHSPSDNAAVTSARVMAASSEAPVSFPLTVVAIFRLKSLGIPQCVAVSSFSPYQKQNVSISVYGIKLNTNNDALFTTLFHLHPRPAVSDLTANVKPTIALSQFKITLIRMRVTNGSSNRRDGLSVSELLISPEIFKAVNNGGIQKFFPIHALSVRASIGSLLPDSRFKITLIRMRVTNGSSNRLDGLSVSEFLMSPEIFTAVNNGGIQKLFPIHACIGNRKKGETALMYVAVNGKKLVIRTLSQEEKIPQISFDLVFEKEFELSHSLVRERVYFIDYKTPDLDE